MQSKPPFPPFTLQTALLKVQAAEDAWNTKDPDRVSLAYTTDCSWRNRNEFISGTEAIKAFLRRKWQTENGYHLKKTLWCFADNRIAVCFEYEWHNQLGQWYRSYGNENWEFADNGLMKSRQASINDVAITISERKFVEK
jgi:nuclear transport factor 2 (NTF2) superfamily protein